MPIVHLLTVHGLHMQPLFRIQHGQPPIVYVSAVAANFALNRENGKVLWELQSWISLFGPIDCNGR